MPRYGLTWLAIFIAIALMFLRLPQMVAKQDAVLNTYSALVEVDALIRQKFVDPIRDNRLVHGAIRGMMFQLDPYSSYVAPDELAAVMRHSRGDYIGIGVELGMRGGLLTVIAPIDGSPASGVGVRAGDAILSIDDQDVKGYSVFDVERLLSGPPGSRTRLRLRHPGERETRTVTVVRGPISLRTVRGFARDDGGAWQFLIDPDPASRPACGIGYIRISNVLDTTTRDFDLALSELREAGVCGLVMDLRFNPGGSLQEAVALVDRFVDDGTVLSTVTRHRAVQEYRATRSATATDMPLAVLINGASASAAEIVAGSLQSLGRAIVIGERSFGKGSVQHLIQLTGHAGAVRLTTAYYRLPDGRIIHRTHTNALTDAWGVMPDIAVKLSDAETHAIQASRWELDVRASSAGGGTLQGSTSTPHTLPYDRQLLAALSYLRETSADRGAPGLAGPLSSNNDVVPVTDRRRSASD